MLKTSINYAFNFELKKRNKNQINFLIFHYTGMRSEKAAIKRLTGIQPKVSSHFFIKNSGEINEIPGLVYRKGNEVIANDYVRKKNISEIPNPAGDL